MRVHAVLQSHPFVRSAGVRLLPLTRHTARHPATPVPPPQGLHGGPRLVSLPPWLEVFPVSFLLSPTQCPQQPGGGSQLLSGVVRVRLRCG